MRFLKCVGVMFALTISILSQSADAQQRLRMAERFASNAPDGTGRPTNASFTPRHLKNRTTVAQEILPNTFDEGQIVSSGCSTCGDSVGAPIDEIIGGDCACNDGTDCGWCGDCGNCRRCWLDGAGGIFYNAEYFVGAQGFRGFDQQGGIRGTSDSSFGLHAGVNTGLPLQWLTCGWAAGQIGISTVQSHMDDRPFGDNREQIFVTAGFFRKVDYGLQGGMVYDYLKENWSVTTELAQIRGELSWAFPNQGEFGFRYADGVKDNRLPNNNFFDTEILNTYRFFLRKPTCYGGITEFFGGWTEFHGLIGANADVPIAERWSVRSSFTYLISGTNDNIQLNVNDGWNVSMSLVFRPRGLCWHQNYTTPMFNVADNGTMMIWR